MTQRSNGKEPAPGDNDGIPDMTGKPWEEVQAWAARNGYTLRQVASVNVDKPSPVPFRVSLTLLGPGQDATVVADEPGQKSKLVSGGTTYTVALPGQPPAPASSEQQLFPETMKIEEAMAYLRLERRTIQYLVARGELRAKHFGKRALRFDKSELERYKKAH